MHAARKRRRLQIIQVSGVRVYSDATITTKIEL